jgi:Bacterial toxin 30
VRLPERTRFFDEAGVERIRIHDINPNAPLGSNSANGWIVRVQTRAANGKTIYFDDLGNVGGKFDNATHIPLAGNPNVGR